jgi:hypothetical protein
MVGPNRRPKRYVCSRHQSGDGIGSQFITKCTGLESALGIFLVLRGGHIPGVIDAGSPILFVPVEGLNVEMGRPSSLTAEAKIRNRRIEVFASVDKR